MSNEQRVVPLAGLEHKVVQYSEGGLAQLVVDKDTGELLVKGTFESTPRLGTAASGTFVSGITNQIVQALPANPSRKGFSCQNMSVDESVGLIGDNFSIRIPPDGLYENHPTMDYTGALSISGVTGTSVYIFELI